MNKNIKTIFITAVLLFYTYTTYSEETLELAIKTKLKTQEQAIESQKKVDQLSEKTKTMLEKYQDAIYKIDNLKSENDLLSNSIIQQQKQLNITYRQLNNIEKIQSSIIPLMLKMIDSLEMFINLDMPFLLKERQQRIANIKKIMAKSELSLPDKYQRIMEAYQIEIEYGRNIESYTEEITIDNKPYTVDILKIGRLLMVFQTLNGKLSGVWNKSSNKWEELSSKYTYSIKKGIQIAKKQSPPELIKLPIQVGVK